VYRSQLESVVTDPKMRAMMSLMQPHENPSCRFKDHKDLLTAFTQLMRTPGITEESAGRIMKINKTCSRTWPTMVQSISVFMAMYLRAAFHKGLPSGDKIFVQITDKLIAGALKDPNVGSGSAGPLKVLRDALLPQTFGFERPVSAGAELLSIAASYAAAAFFSEMDFPGPKKFLVKLMPKGKRACTWNPHSTWHKKNSHVINKFIQFQKHKVVQNPSTMTALADLMQGSSTLLKSVVTTVNMGKVLMMPTDLVDCPALFATQKKRFTDWQPSFDKDRRCAKAATAPKPAAAPKPTATLKPAATTAPKPAAAAKPTATLKPAATATPKPAAVSAKLPSRPLGKPEMPKPAAPSSSSTATAESAATAAVAAQNAADEAAKAAAEATSIVAAMKSK